MTPLKDLGMVFLYNPKEDTVSFMDHNIPLFEAVRQVANLSKKGIYDAFCLMQSKKHRPLHAEKCRLCEKELISTIGHPVTVFKLKKLKRRDNVR